MGNGRLTRPPAEVDRFEREVVAVRAALGEEGFESGWAAGRRLSPDHAIAEALADEGAD